MAGCCLLAACWACSMELPSEQLPEDGTPVKIMAEIEEPAKTKAAVEVGAYDRSAFSASDKIIVYRLENDTRKQQAGYTYSGSAWATSETTPVTLQAGSTYEAVFPADYTSILQDQSASDGSGFLRSNLLKTGRIASRDGVLRFTGSNGGAFKHQNVKLTLVFQLSGGGTLQDAVTNNILSAAGLVTGGNAVENIALFRPDPDVYTWCGIVYPKGSTTTLTLQLTYRGVTYKTTLDCGLQAGQHYTYTLTLQNGILVPTGSSIAGWKSEPDEDYTGKFESDEISGS